MSKIGAQCQEKGEDIYLFNQMVQPNSIKAINVTDADFWQRISDENPRLQYAIYRECPNGIEPFNSPEDAAQAWIVGLKAKVGHLVDAGLITHIEGYNEWVHSFQAEHFPAADRFMATLIDECHKQFGGKVHIIVLNASCGHFADDILNFPKTLAKLNEGCGCMLGLHEYDRERMNRSHLEDIAKGGEGYWLCGKFKRVEKALKGAGYDNVPIALTEVGLDDAVDRPAGSHHWGWQHYGATTEEAAAHFLNEENLAWYYPLLMASDMVKLASIFGCQMYYDQNWGEWGFDIRFGFPALLDGIRNLEGAEPPPPEPPEEEDMDLEKIKVFAIDEDTEQMVELTSLEDKEALVFDKYGVAFRRAEVAPGQKVYRLVELWEKTGPASLVTQVLGEDGNPVANMGVAFYWPDAPDPPDPPTPLYAHDWYHNFVHGPTNDNGDVGPGMGTGAYHGVGEGGPHAVWVRDPNILSDICEKLGMLAGTPHDHLDQKFKLMIAGENGEEEEQMELVFVERLVETSFAAMLGIAMPADYAVEHDARGDFRGPGVDDTIHPGDWDHPNGTQMALIEGCADFAGDEPREYTMQAIDIGTGEELTEVVAETFEPLGAPRERIIYVFDVGEPGPEPPPIPPEGVISILYGIAADLEDRAVDLRAIGDGLVEAQELAANLNEIFSGK